MDIALLNSVTPSNQYLSVLADNHQQIMYWVYLFDPLALPLCLKFTTLSISISLLILRQGGSQLGLQTKQVARMKPT